MFHDGDVNTMNNIMGFAKIVTNFWKLQGENRIFPKFICNCIVGKVYLY